MTYQDMYVTLFRRVTEAIEQIEAANYGRARELLIRAQQETEELYLREEGQ